VKILSLEQQGNQDMVSIIPQEGEFSYLEASRPERAPIRFGEETL
jgi:hypothetical protein